VGETIVWKWRQALGVERFNEGSALLRETLNRELGEGLCGVPQSEEHVRRRVATRKAKGVRPPQRWKNTGWKPEHLALLGKVPDDEIAELTGRSHHAVRLRRERLNLPN
jgi:hypothetical protein